MPAFTEFLSVMLPTFMLVALRIGIAFAVMPAPFGSRSPVAVRAVLTMFMSMLLTTLMGPSGVVASSHVYALLGFALGEILIGGVIGLTVRVSVASAEIAGSAAGMAMGLGFASTIDPTMGEEVLPTTTLLSMIAVAVFFIFGGHHAVIEALAASLILAPPGQALAHISWERLSEVGRSTLAQGLRIALPVMASMFIVQVGVGLVSRIAPRVQVLMLTFAATAAVGMASFHRAGTGVVYAISDLMERLPDVLRGLIVGT